MKKNRMMRLASGLLVAVLATTSMISGTYAKYVTTDSASDSARVAKWGVEITTSGSLFGKYYVAAEENGIILSDVGTVASNDSNNVVAPGTKNAEGITATITGTPEVDVKVLIGVKGKDVNGNVLEDVNDIFLKAGTYPDMTTTDDPADTDDYDEFELEEIYYPVEFTLTQTIGGTENTLETGTLADVAKALSDLSTTYEANTVLDDEIGTLNLTWKWEFGTAATDAWTANIEDTDRADTLLGNLMAGTATGVDSSEYNLETGLEISIVVEQID